MALPSEIDSGDGRRFLLRDANPGDMLDLIEAAGAAASSTAWMRYALMICSVSAIDGKPIMMPATKQSVRELGKKIGNIGMEALARAHYPDDETSVDSQHQDKEIDIAKN